MESRITVLPWVVLAAACVAPRAPAPLRAPAPDLYERAAAPEPAARAAAAGELAFDPSPRGTKLLLTLQRRDVDPAVRRSAAAAIAERRDPLLGESLRTAAASDPDPGVRGAAASAHARLWPWRKQPHTAAALSLICPGCGQAYLGARGEAAAYLSATAALAGTSVALLRGQDVTLGGEASSARVPAAIPLILAAQNLWFYSIFDAYRDARVLRDDHGYRHKITRESLGELATAPFRPSVLKSPWVWGGVPIALGTGLAVSYLMARGSGGGMARPSIGDVQRINVLGRDLSRGAGFAAGTGYHLAMFAPVGVGEEALFRGLIQTELEERFGTAGGLATASLIFGATHVLNFLDDPKTAAIAIPVISVLGSSLGLAYIKTGHKLSTSVAMHFWYDFLLSTAAFVSDPQHQPFVVQYGRAM